MALVDLSVQTVTSIVTPSDLYKSESSFIWPETSSGFYMDINTTFYENKDMQLYYNHHHSELIMPQNFKHFQADLKAPLSLSIPQNDSCSININLMNKTPHSACKIELKKG